jgi:hypothetical protein
VYSVMGCPSKVPNDFSVLIEDCALFSVEEESDSCVLPFELLLQATNASDTEIHQNVFFI